MRIAIYYTGLLRTFEKTYTSLITNVLQSNPEHQYDLFISLDHKDHFLTMLLIEKLGPWIRSLNLIDTNDPEYQNVLNRSCKILSERGVLDYWTNYLRRSGSVIEFYQAYQSYLSMLDYEEEHGFRYDSIIRIRMDSLINQPLDYNWLQITEEEIRNRIQHVSEEVSGTRDLLRIITCSLLNPKILSDKNYKKYGFQNFTSDENGFYCHQNDSRIQTILQRFKNQSWNDLTERERDIFARQLAEYIRNGEYVLSCRVNILYIINRNVIDQITILGKEYGHRKNYIDKDYWFNAESQFQNICYWNNLSVFDYNTNLEDRSLYEYNPDNYFIDGRMNPDLFHILVRS